jgi:HPt (histidine-containing phosphotransfer) domain-containing protein
MPDRVSGKGFHTFRRVMVECERQIRANMPMSGDVPVFNLQATLRRLRGDESLLIDVVKFFHEDAPPLLKKIEWAIRLNDLPGVVRAAHSLCGLAATFDGLETIEAALQVEQVAHQNALRSLPEAVQTLAAAVRRLDEALAREIEEQEVEGQEL